MVQPVGVTDQQVMGLDTSDLHDLVLTYPKLHTRSLRKQGQYHHCRWSCRHALVAEERQIMRVQIETDLSQDHAVD